jgi:hypothetical protein
MVFVFWFVAGASCPVHMVSATAIDIYLKFSNFFFAKKVPGQSEQPPGKPDKLMECN